MYTDITNKKGKNVLLMLGSVFIIVTFIIGFIFGGSFMYSITAPEINDLQYQMNILESNNDLDNNVELQNNNYFYNGTSLSDIYKKVKDSIVVISGIGSYQIFWQTRFYEVQGSGFVYNFEDEMIVITNNHVVADVSEIVVTFSNGNSYSGELMGSDPYSDLAIL